MAVGTEWSAAMPLPVMKDKYSVSGHCGTHNASLMHYSCFFFKKKLTHQSGKHDVGNCWYRDKGKLRNLDGIFQHYYCSLYARIPIVWM